MVTAESSAVVACLQVQVPARKIDLLHCHDADAILKQEGTKLVGNEARRPSNGC